MHTHHMTRRQTSTALVWACLVLGSLSTTATAQTAFPTKPIILVVTYPPGGGADGPGMWARVRRRVEAALKAMPFRHAGAVRPGFICARSIRTSPLAMP